MDETAIAFDLPHVRAAATAGATSLDRISVRDYTRAVEIGVFRSERGITQRIRFNVVLEVCHSAAARDDDVDQVISYDTITATIERVLAAERINLLETLAERIAAGCLVDARAVRVFVRVEKLDRIPGALGVEIARARPSPEALPLHPAAAPPEPEAARPHVVLIPAAALDGPDAPSWRDALARLARPSVFVIAPAEAQPPAAAEGALRIGLMALEAPGWRLADRDARFTVTASRTELDWALRTGRHPVWAPTKMLLDALPRPALDASRPASLAAWLAAEIGAKALVLAAGVAEGDASSDLPLRHAGRPDDLQA
jgi:dihydroneopterin aldolase